MQKVRTAFAALLLLIAACHKIDSQSTENVEESATTNDFNAAGSAPEPGVQLIHCGVVERQVTQEDCDELGAIKLSVREGVAAFNVPSPMIRNRPKTITLVIDR